MAVKSLKRKTKKSEKGMAFLEAVPVLIMLTLIFNFSLGFFGAVHSGILNSIASYNYAIETFRFKSNLMYFRPGGGTTHYAAAMNRVHGTTQDGSEAPSGREDKNKWPATQRGITFNYKRDDPKRNLSMVQDGPGKIAVSDNVGDHEWISKTSNTNVWKADSKYAPETGEAIQTPRIWIKTVYGICLTAECGE